MYYEYGSERGYYSLRQMIALENYWRSENGKTFIYLLGEPKRVIEEMII